MSLAGKAAVAIWHDLVPEAKDAFYEWHNREHMPERAAIPGFLRGRRYIAVEGTPEYFNLYEAERFEVLSGPDYLDRLNHPTEWTRRVVPSFRNVSRSLCRVAYSEGVGQGGLIATLRFDIDGARRDEALAALCDRLLPPLTARVGIAGMHLCLADEEVSGVDTAEKRARADATLVPTWIALVEGTRETDVRDAAQRLAADLHAFHPPTDIALSVYRVEHTRCKTASTAG